jgi:septal ring factor EnvC (AmiA/AmiB activator)
MGSENTTDFKTDIALIKKDISQIEKMLSKLDLSIEKISSISKTIAIQERIVENHEKRIDDLNEKIIQHHKEEEEFRRHVQAQIDGMVKSNKEYIDELKAANTSERERHHKEIMESINTLHIELKNKNKEQDTRLSTLENWRWWLTGIGTAIAAGFGYFFNKFFG